MARLTDNRTGRPKGRKDKKLRKRKEDTAAAQKKRSDAAKQAARTRARQRAEKAATMKADRPDVEKSTVKVTPYPRAGDNPEFEAFLNTTKAQADQQSDRRDPGSQAPKTPGELLQVKDVAEWCAWPFMLWAQSNNLSTLKLTDAEALDLAEPLTSILNRHGVADVVPPDVLDILKFTARATPVMADRFSQIKRERRKRTGDGAPVDVNVGAGHGGPAPVQGAQQRQPKEV
jgi:hypothetical protein